MSDHVPQYEQLKLNIERLIRYRIDANEHLLKMADELPSGTWLPAKALAAAIASLIAVDRLQRECEALVPLQVEVPILMSEWHELADRLERESRLEHRVAAAVSYTHLTLPTKA